jgi:hypothetical protein
VLVYPSSMQVSNRALQTFADGLRHHRRSLGSRWRRLPAGRQALLVLAHLTKARPTPHSQMGWSSATARSSAPTAARHSTNRPRYLPSMQPNELHEPGATGRRSRRGLAARPGRTSRRGGPAAPGRTPEGGPHVSIWSCAARSSAVTRCSRRTRAGAASCGSTSTSTATPAPGSARAIKRAGRAWSRSCCCAVAGRSGPSPPPGCVEERMYPGRRFGL